MVKKNDIKVKYQVLRKQTFILEYVIDSLLCTIYLLISLECGTLNIKL